MTDPDEIRAVLALGMVAGTLALSQFWAATHEGLFGEMLHYPEWGAGVQTFFFRASLMPFAVYLSLLTLAVGLDGVSGMGINQDPLRACSRWEFLAGWFVSAGTVVVAVVRILAKGERPSGETPLPAEPAQ